MKIAAAVILYQPKDVFLLNIKSYYSQVEKVYIFDNSEKEPAIKRELHQLSKVEYYNDGINKGLSKRLNEACYLAGKDGFDWLLTMDQDSDFADKSFTFYLDCFSKFEHKQNAAMFGTYNYRAVIASSEKCDAKEANDIMTSGTLINLSLFKKIGNFDEALFIDCVDHDYCIRAISAGYSIIRFNNIYLSHQLGKEVYRSSIKTLFLVKKKKEIHSPLRCYYMYRNILYLTKKFEKENIPQVKQIKKDVIARIKKAFLYGRNSAEIICFLKRARRDYKNNQMGKISEIK
jgi:rhamnosyltransferase